MNLDKIKVLKIDITEWLIDAIYSAKENESKNRFILAEDFDIIEFNLTHEDFDFFIDFDLYYDSCHVSKLDVSCEFKNYSHVSDMYPEPYMIDFDDTKLDKITKAVLTHI